MYREQYKVYRERMLGIKSFLDDIVLKCFTFFFPSQRDLSSVSYLSRLQGPELRIWIENEGVGSDSQKITRIQIRNLSPYAKDPTVEDSC